MNVKVNLVGPPNLAMRVLRALFNFAASEYEDENGRSLILENPVSRISPTRAWFRVERRKSVIKAHELLPWYQAIQKIKATHEGYQCNTICDCLLLILFTGLRRAEAMSLRFDNIDFKAKTLTISDTKNHEQHVLPLPDFLYELLQKRRKEAVSELVFRVRVNWDILLNLEKLFKKSHSKPVLILLCMI